jgi:ketosteroid isomerase-like protein
MSEANVEIAKRAIDAFNRRELGDAYDELFTPDHEWFAALVGAFEGGSFRGREGMEAYAELRSEAWEELRVLPAEFRDLGDRVICLGRMEGRGRGSGVRVEAPLGAVFEFRDGKISRMRAFLDHGEALRAAGLPE